MPTPLGPLEGARNAVIAKLISGLSTDTAKIAAIKDLDRRLSEAKTPVEIPRIVEKGWLRTEDLDDVVSAVEVNLTYVALMADLLRAAGAMSQALIDTRAQAADTATKEAEHYINDLLLYLAARKAGGDAIIVNPKDITGDFSTFGGAIIPKVVSANRANIAVKSVNTNGFKGNLLEIDKNTDVGTSLQSVKFIDPNGDRADAGQAFDEDEDSIFEVEALKIVDDEWIEFGVTKWISGVLTNISWNEEPNGGKLIAEIVARVPGGRLSTLALVPDLSNTEKIDIDSVEFTKDDSSKWVSAVGKSKAGRATGAYEGVDAGTALWVIPGGRAKNIKIRISQDTPYRTKVATADFVAHGTTTPLVPGVPLTDISSKRQYFTPSTSIQLGNKTLDRKIVARLADRWCIAIKSIDGRANEYTRSSTFQTDSYDLPAECERVAISVDEIIPDGCTVSYEISHDGVTWSPISPVGRTSGREVVIFGSGGNANPIQDPGATFVQTDKPVKTLALRVLMTTRGTDAPAISNIAIHPLLKR